MAAAPDPVRVIGVQIAALKLKQPNLGPGFLQCKLLVFLSW